MDRKDEPETFGQFREVIVKFEQIPLFYPRGCAAQLREIATIDTLERFVLYCLCWLSLLARPRGHGETLQGGCPTGHILTLAKPHSLLQALLKE